MIEIFFDGEPAIPKEGQTIKLTAENPFFTKSTSYTYDVELPLSIEANRRIFGDIQRMDIQKEPRLMEARMVVDNITVLSGTAHITNVSDSSVKVQLLGEAASYNYGNKMDDTYIDEIDLGNWFMVTWEDGSHWNYSKQQWEHYPEGTKFRGTARRVFERVKFNADGTYTEDNILAKIYNGTFPWVAYPVMNTNADIYCNGFAYRYIERGSSKVKPFFRGYSGQRASRPTDNPVVQAACVQPFVWIIAELVAKATGFRLAREDNALYKNAFFKRIFIVNANNMIECNKCLPHWTVNEFWTQLENTFGLVLSIDYAGKRMYLRQRADHYRHVAETVYLKQVVDEYSVEMDDDSEADISVNNVGFADFDNDPGDLLEEYITENCEVNEELQSVDELLAWAKTNQDTLSEYKGTLFKCKDGRQFIYSESEGIVEVNQFRPRLTDAGKDATEVELKFVPARFAEGVCEVFDYRTHNQGWESDDTAVASFPVTLLQVPDKAEMDWYKSSNKVDLDIEAILKEEEEAGNKESDKNDCIIIAVMPDTYFDDLTVTITYKDGRTAEGAEAKYPRPRLREKVKAALTDSTATKEDAPFSLSLIPIEGQENLAKHTISNAVVIDAKARQCIKFIAEKIPDPSSIFMIHNRRFVGEKIEPDISSSGLQRLLTGYFYELQL